MKPDMFVVAHHKILSVPFSLSLTLNFSKINNKSLIFCLSSSDKSWYEDLLDDGLKSTLTVCPSVLSNFKYWGTRPYDSTNQSAVSSFDLNYFNFLDLLFSIINASPSLCANEHMFIIKTH